MNARSGEDGAHLEAGVMEWLDRHERADAERHRECTGGISDVRQDVGQLKGLVEGIDRQLMDTVDAHGKTLYGDGDKDPGLKLKVDRLEQRRMWYRGLAAIVWGALISIATLALSNRDLLPGGQPQAPEGPPRHGSFRP
jgi:hypothetical protein